MRGDLALFVFFIIRVSFCEKVEHKAAILRQKRTYIMSCHSLPCQRALANCTNVFGCIGAYQCRKCMNSYDECDRKCVDDLLDQNDYVDVNGQLYLQCDVSMQHQVNACKFMCRMKYMPISRCILKDERQICECSSVPFTLPTRPMTVTISLGSNYSTLSTTTTGSKLPTSILPGNCRYIEQLNSGDIVCSNPIRIIIWSLSSIGIRLYLPTSNSNGFADNLLVMPNDDLVAAYRNILLWDTKSGTLKMNMSGHSAAVTSLALLKSGDLATGGDDQLIKIWNMKSGQLKRNLTGHASRILALTAFGDDYLANSVKGLIRIWNTTTGEIIKNITTVNAEISCLADLTNGYLASSIVRNQASVSVREIFRLLSFFFLLAKPKQS
jgi:WD40 repeat protein